MFKQLFNFEVFYQLKQRAFPIFAILFLALGIFVGRQGFAPKGVDFNSVYQVYFHTGLFTLGSVFIIMFFAISAILRDKQYNMESLIFSSSVKKKHYFWSRFLGTFIFSVLAFSPFLIGYVFGNYFSNLDPERLSDFQLLTYLQPWLYIVLPNIFVCSTIVFSVSTLTKNSTATYVSAVFVYMLYFVCSIFLNSPLLAQSVPASPESMAIAAVTDLFGIAAFFEQTQYWTPFQKNTQLLSFSGLFLINRLVWILISIGILLSTYRVFSFRKINKKAKTEKKVKKDSTRLVYYKPLLAIYNFKAQQLAFLSLLKLELKNVFKSLPFIAVLIMWLFIVFSELYSTVVSGGEYGVNTYPFTNQLIDLIVNPLTLFSLILIIFYSSEIVWKERSLNFNLVVDALPTKNSVFFLSKFSTILLLPVILITTGILMCIIFQVSLNYTNFEFYLYASLYYHYGLQLAVFSMIALFVSSLAKNKYMGMGMFGLIVLLSLKSNVLGLEHPLTSLGFLPRVSYSNMNGFYGRSNLFNHLALYWLAFGLLLIALSFKIWNRGEVANFSVKLKLLITNWSKIQKMSLSFLIISFIGFGSLVFYNMNIVSDYETISDRLDFREQYERQFKQFESLERPYPISRKIEVAIFPKERRYTVKANYILKNGSEQPLSEIFITERIPLKTITIENATLIKQDTDFGIYRFKFKEALQPNDAVVYNFELKNEIKGYEENRAIVRNGTYITHNDFEPMLGYSPGLEIIDRVEREKRNLPKRIEENISDSHIELEDFKNERIHFETIVSTDSDQTALSSGNLINKWSENDRNFYHYKSKERVMPMIAYFSAKYVSKKINYKGVSIEQYFDENHSFNIEEIEHSIKQTLDYCQENFGAYQFDHVRIAELPSHWSFGGFAHPGVISMVEDRLYLSNVNNPNTFNLVAKRTIHEVGHQWWGHTLSAKPVAGGSLFIEGFAKYTEAVVMEKMYGKRAIYELSENARSRYFLGRSYARDIEPPVYKVLGQSYISYGKALTVMLALRDLIGEKNVNLVLKTLTDKHRNSNKLKVTSIDFLKEIYAVAPIKQHKLINDWFKKVITYDLVIDDSSYQELANGTYEVTVKVNAKRFETLDTGEIKQISINEPIKIGVFNTHPSSVRENNQILHYQSSTIDDEISEIKIIVKEKPVYIAIDPYGTRSDENIVDNIFEY
ncbi:peptidase M1-like protein [Aquimarina sp. MAR_2010_214]|uniref:ABC transporter permease/M1 family aminopeptidase n=1 Tax=Aquimarina sp. MAR_2010_214 TaxID=1250026 RepID=UPI000C71591B|nr:M1 family aminopeptidase [Aquimarina sp. MAR_2010_214]PKV51392.1 peptidase M1-like protein [Aquimarina sp. MAR_2010_214]